MTFAWPSGPWAVNPFFSGVVVLVLALGIGGTTAIYTLAEGILIQPLAFSDADQLVNISHSAPARGLDDLGQCAAWHLTYEDSNRVFEDIGMYIGGTATVTGLGSPTALPVVYASSGVFRALRLSPVLGRSFTPDDEVPDGPLAVILGHGYWEAQFGSDRDVVGRTIEVDGASWEIVGVAPPEMRSLEEDPALILPIRFDRARTFIGNIGFGSVARLKDGVTLEEARADVERLLPLAWEKFPGNPAASGRPDQYTVLVQPLKDRLVGSVADVLWILLAGVGVVLAIACANVANLFLVRAEAREGELALRTALGASRARIGWETTRESLLLGLLGGIAGLGFAYGGLRMLSAIAPADIPRLQNVTLDGSVLLFTLGLSVATGVLFGLLPGRRNLSGRGVTGRMQNGLVMSQVALALLLLVASGLMLRTMMSLRDVDPGFGAPEEVLAFRLTIPTREMPDIEEAASAFERIARRLEEIPGVESVAMATRIPMDATGNVNPFYVDGIAPPGGDGPPPFRRQNWLGQGYFETLQIPLVAGRAFTWDDVHARFPGAIISESLAREYWNSPEEAIGQRVSARPEPARWHEVVGVAADVRYRGVAEDPALMVYWPQVTLGFWQGTTLEQVQSWRGMGFALRSDRVGTPGLVDDVREAVWEISPNLPVRNVSTLPELMSQSVAQVSFTMTLLSVASGMALLLGLVGVYGVMAYAVSRQTRELGVRLALGASSADLRAMVLRNGIRVAGLGVLVGLGLAWAVTRLMAGLLFGVSVVDPVTFVVAAVGLTLAAAAACYIPATRAGGVDPIEVLKAV